MRHPETKKPPFVVVGHGKDESVIPVGTGQDKAFRLDAAFRQAGVPVYRGVQHEGIIAWGFRYQ